LRGMMAEGRPKQAAKLQDKLDTLQELTKGVSLTPTARVKLVCVGKQVKRERG
jgi:hypothetical protein